MSVGEKNETFFIREWKPLTSRHVLKTLRGSPKGKACRRQYLLAVGLGCYKWYQSKKSGYVPTRRLSSKGRWTLGSVLARTLGPKEGGESYINWRRERVPTRTLESEREWIVRSHIGWGGKQNILYKGVETSP